METIKKGEMVADHRRFTLEGDVNPENIQPKPEGEKETNKKKF